MNIAVIRKTQVARPLKVLVPLIQGELQQGDTAGRTHYPMLHLSPHTGSFLAAEFVAGSMFLVWAACLVLLCIGLS